MSMNQAQAQAVSCPTVDVQEEGADDGDGGRACQSDADCPEGQVCQNGQCVQPTAAFGLSRTELAVAGGASLGLLGLGVAVARGRQ